MDNVQLLYSSLQCLRVHDFVAVIQVPADIANTKSKFLQAQPLSVNLSVERSLLLFDVAVSMSAREAFRMCHQHLFETCYIVIQ
jgi:hypothetical protein